MVQVGDRVRVTGGRYRWKTGTVVKVMQVYVLVKHDNSGEERRSAKTNCVVEGAGSRAKDRAPTATGDGSNENVKALVEATAAVVGERAADEVEELVVLFAKMARSKTRK